MDKIKAFTIKCIEYRKLAFTIKCTEYRKLQHKIRNETRIAKEPSSKQNVKKFSITTNRNPYCLWKKIRSISRWTCTTAFINNRNHTRGLIKLRYQPLLHFTFLNQSSNHVTQLVWINQPTVFQLNFPLGSRTFCQIVGLLAVAGHSSNFNSVRAGVPQG